MTAHPESHRIRIEDGEFLPTRDIPFSPALDELIAAIRAGKAPNLGRFCGYCCAPLGDRRERCETCGTEVGESAPRDKISRALAAVYTGKRKQEARIIHGAAWLGILIGTAISVGLIVALPGWTKVFAVIFLIAGSYYLASYLGNVLAQNYAYRAGLRLFARRWQEYLRGRETGTVDDEA